MTETTTNTPEVEAAIQETRDRYKLAFGKDVANSMKNNVEWMNQKMIDEITSKPPIPGNDPQSTSDPKPEVPPIKVDPTIEAQKASNAILEQARRKQAEEELAKIEEEKAAKEEEEEAKKPKITTTTSMGKELPVTKKSHAIYKSFMERTGCNILDLTNNAAIGKHAPTEEELDAIRREVKRTQTTQTEMPSKLKMPKHIKVIIDKYGIPLLRLQDKEFVKEVITTGSNYVIERYTLELVTLDGEVKAKKEKELEEYRVRMAHEITEIEAYIDHLNNNRQ